MREQVGERTDLQPGRADVGEVARARLCERLVERFRGLVECLNDIDARLGQWQVERGEQLRGDRRLDIARGVELLPCGRDEIACVIEGPLPLELHP